MSTQNHFLAGLSYIDQRLDDLNEEFGDLPELEKEKQRESINTKIQVEETQQILEEITKFVASAKITLVELKDREDKLVNQQFLSRNNKEFDAISREIDQIRLDHTSLSEKMRSEGIKDENLNKILEEQKANYETLQKEIKDISLEIEELAGEQKQEVRDLKRQKDSCTSKITTINLKEYNRIRKNYNDAAVQVKRNSCSGCYNAVPTQRIVEIRNNKDMLFLCENCGRILLSDDLEINDDLVKSLI
jgi:predicted  nucleic acid-binding Zn-ribbon protein